MRTKVEFPVNQPTPITLDFHPQDTPVQRGTYGDDYRYVVNNDQGILFARPELHALIVQSGAQAGDEIYVTRRQQGKKITWEVQKVAEEPAPPPPAARQTQQQQPARVNGHANGNGSSSQPAPVAPAAAPSAQQPQPADVLVTALVAAVEAAAIAEHRARQHNMAIHFQAEDIRAMAATLIIGGRR